MKRYGLILTCMTIRAIHLEVLPTLSTNGFIDGLRRFISKRGVPEKIIVRQWDQLRRSTARIGRSTDGDNWSQDAATLFATAKDQLVFQATSLWEIVGSG